MNGNGALFCFSPCLCPVAVSDAGTTTSLEKQHHSHVLAMQPPTGAQVRQLQVLCHPWLIRLAGALRAPTLSRPVFSAADTGTD